MTSKVFVFSYLSGDENERYNFRLVEKLGSRTTSESPACPANKTSGTPLIISGLKTPSSIILNAPVNSVKRILFSSITAIPQGWLIFSARF